MRQGKADRGRTLTLGIALGVVAVAAAGPDDEPLRVRAQVPRGTSYVGQAIELRVGVVAAGERPRIIPPLIADAIVSTIGTDLKPVSASGIGDLVEERNLFLTRFRIVPRRAGVLTVPPVVARLGDRSGASPPVKLAIVDPPIAGRPAEFLGGIGAFDLGAEASATVVRSGQELEYHLQVVGPAARGMTGAPSLKRFEALPIAPRVEPIGPAMERVDDPPSRLFRFRLRPTRPGAVVLPPVAIAAFDPSTGRYVTKVTAGIPLRVQDVPRFDSRALNYAPTHSSGTSRTGGTLAAVATGLVGAALLGPGLHQWLRPSRARQARRIAAEQARTLRRTTSDVAETARTITDGLIRYLRIEQGRPPGALTPVEAERSLGAMAAQLVTRCDRALYAASADGSAEMLNAAGRRLFDVLAKRGRTERGSRDHPNVGRAIVNCLSDDTNRTDDPTSDSATAIRR